MNLGCTYELAASYAGIHVSTLFGWLAKGREGMEGFSEFFDDVKKAEAQCAMGALGIVIQAARGTPGNNDGDWKAAAWLLERRHQYDKKERPSIEINIEADSIPAVELMDKLMADQDLVSLIRGPVIDLDE
ncbi:MAG: hypothetical protein CMO80_21905 [Verrucomicrobiales bacterium]|nr:hypothetical protein [Verrucomicrobiales bacterium]